MSTTTQPDETSRSPAPIPTDEEIAEYATTGYLVWRGAIAPADVERISAAVDELERWAGAGPGREGGPGLHHFELTDSGPALARSEDFLAHSDVLRRLVTTGRIPELLERLLGEPAVIFKEKINYKQPGGAGFAPHQDAAAYRFVDHHVSVMVPIDPATIASGTLYFAHKPPGETLLPNERGRITPEAVAALVWEPVELAPGDLVFFDSYTPHYSQTNTTERARRAAYLTYNRVSLGSHRDTYYADKRAEFAAEGDDFAGERVRLSISDDFLGRPVEADR